MEMTLIFLLTVMAVGLHLGFSYPHRVADAEDRLARPLDDPEGRFDRGPWDMDMADPWMEGGLPAYGVHYWSQLVRQLCDHYINGVARPELEDEDEETRLVEECENWQTGGPWRGNGPSLDMMELIFSNKGVVDQLRSMAQ